MTTMSINGKGLEEFNIHFKTSRKDLFLEVAKVCEAVIAKDEDQTPFEENASQGPVEKHSRPACTLLEVLNAMPNEQKVRLFIEGEEICGDAFILSHYVNDPIAHAYVQSISSQNGTINVWLMS